MAEADPRHRAGGFQADSCPFAGLGFDATPFLNAEVAHPLLCERHRPVRPPRHLPRTGRSRPAAPAERWGEPSARSALGGGAVRNGMTWRQAYDTSTTFCTKSGRNMFFEGPHEPASFRMRTVDHECVDVQFQPLVLDWRSDAIGRRAYFVDSAELRADGWIVFRENKAHTAYFDDPDIDAKLAAAASFLTSFPKVRFERECGSWLMDRVRWRSVKDVFDLRMAPYSKSQAAAAADTVRGAGGTAALDEVERAVDPDPMTARQAVCAMLVDRRLAFDADAPLRADIPVRMPRAAVDPTRLRDFLRMFAPEGSA